MAWKPPTALKKYISKGDLQPPLRIVAHRRAGNHFLWESLHINYNIEDAAGDAGDKFKYHRPYKDAPENFTNDYTCVFLIRDPRDTLVSNWFYWQNGGEEKSKIKEVLVAKTFSDFLHGTDPKEIDKFNPELDKMEMYILKEHIQDPIQHWLDYVAWAEVSKMTIRYEDLRADQEGIIKDFGNRFNLTPTKDHIQTIEKNYGGFLVGYLPRRGIVGDWKNHFSESDLDYILDRAGHVMKEFNYI